MKQKPNFSVQPNFISSVMMVRAFTYGLIGAIALTFGGGIFLMLLFTLLGLSALMSIGTIFTGMFLLGFIGIPIVYYEIKRKNARTTYFKFYDDWVDFSYFSGWLLNRKKGRLYYGDITDMVQNSNFFQRFGNLKTIELHAPNTSFYERGQDFVGILMEDILIGKGDGEKIQDLLQRVYDAQVGAAPVVAEAEPDPAAVPAEEEQVLEEKTGA